MNFVLKRYSEKEIRDYIKENPEKLTILFWREISKYQTLSESFIREFKDKLKWIHISHYQTLSEDFIREFNDQVDWHWISRLQALSEEFLIEFIEKVDIGDYESWGLIDNELIPEDVKNRIKNLKKLLETA